MTLDEFISKWSGKLCDYDGAYSGQCVDLYRMYVKEVLKIPQTPLVVGAKDIWNNCPGFEKIPNTPDNIPLKGDVMIWGSKYGQYGHVAIVTEADINKFTCFSQNDPAGTLPGLKTYKAWSTLLGWLRAKEVITSDLQQRVTDLEKEVLDKNNQIKGYEEQVSGLNIDLGKKDDLIKEITGQLKEANDKSKGFKDERDNILSQCATELGTRQEIVDIIASIKALVKESDDFSDYKKQVELDNKERDYQDALREKKHKDDVDSLGGQLKAVKAQLATLESKYIALKDTQITPSNSPVKYSLLDIIKKLIGVL